MTKGSGKHSWGGDGGTRDMSIAALRSPMPSAEEMAQPIDCIVEFSGFTIWPGPADGSIEILEVFMPGRPLGDRAKFVPAIRVKGGTRIRITGRWSTYKGGPSIEVQHAEALTPEGAGGIARWMENAGVTGLGKKTRAKLALRLGARLEQAISDADMLHEVGGLRRPIAQALAEKWNGDIGVNRVRALLRGFDLKPRQVKAALEMFQADTEEIVRENPWILTNVTGVGFKTCDKVAVVMGLPRDHPQRLHYGVVSTLTEASLRGHTCLTPQDLLNKASWLLGLPANICGPGITSGVEAGDIEVCPETGKIYKAAMIRVERELAREIARLCQGMGGLCGEGEAVTAVEAAEWETGITLDRESGQFDAAVRALSSGLSVITGGPGTGKSTVQGVIVRAAQSLKGMSDEGAIETGAPTGRAAKRLTETTGRKAKTIHRMLEFSPMHGRFMRSRNAALNARLVILDEVSMLDTSLALSLVEAIKGGTSVVLVGDVDQLPSVGPGQVLKDVIDSDVVPVTRLTRVRRNVVGSEIPQAAQRIRAGQHPVPEGVCPKSVSGVHLVEDKNSSEIPEKLTFIMAERITNLMTDPARGIPVDRCRDVQILAAMKKGPVGVEALNDIVRAVVNPNPSASVTVGSRSFGVDDRVMNICNDDARGVSNGDIGEVIEAGRDKDKQPRVVVDFGNGLIATYDGELLDDLVHARASTIHKAQGSEFPVVIVVMPEEHVRMLDRQLFYTALSRAKAHCVLIGNRRVIAAAAAANASAVRSTGLRQRLEALLSAITAQIPQMVA